MLCLVLVGYDVAAEGGVKAMLDQFDQEVGLHYLKAIHLNDSKGNVRTFMQKYYKHRLDRGVHWVI